MSYCITTAFEQIKAMNKRISVVQGGTSAGKTIAILMLLLEYAANHDNKIISVITDTFPNLRTGAMRDWLAICRYTNVDKVTIWNKAEHQMTFPNGTIVEFYSVDTMGALGSRRDILYVNEANRVSWETFSNLEIRTRGRVYVDYNPTAEFWAHTELIGREDTDFVKLTYLDNEGIDDNTYNAIEMRKGDGTSNWWRVFGLGEVGSLEGNVYSGWTPVDGKPDGFALRVVGVDFGFSKDPTAVVAVYENEMNDREIFIQTRLYAHKMLTPDLIATLKEDEEIKDELFVCDNARPEIIAEMCANGLRAIGCNKTAGEKMNGKMYNIDLVQRRKVFYDTNDKDLEKEYLTYAWRKKKSTGEQLAEPEDGNDHAMDALAYAVRELHKTVDDIDDLSVSGDYDYEQLTEEDDGWGDDF